MRTLPLLLLLAACAKPTAASSGGAVAGEPAAERLAVGQEEFAGELYRRLAEDAGDDELFFSPTSVTVALAMTWAGAEGETRQAMAETLHLGEPEATHAALGGLLASWNRDDPAWELSVANRLWLGEGLALREPFDATVSEHYGAGFERIDFARSERARTTINGWVEEQTNDRIQDLLPPGSVDGATRLVLTNAIYFLGSWTHSFDPEQTEEQPFTTLAGEQVQAPLMHRRGRTRYVDGRGWQAVSLPYQGDRLSMLVVLPDEGRGLDAVERQLGPKLLSGVVADLETQEVDLYLPRWTTTWSGSLVEPLVDLGMGPAFQQGGFGGISDEPLGIDAVVHKAFVEVDEQGTEAAAATAVTMATSMPAKPPPPPPTFRADRPFLYAIWDHETGTPLFLGRVASPG